APELFLEIIQYALGRFDTDRATYHISAKLSDVPRAAALSPAKREKVFLNQDAGRQILHVTFGSVLTLGQGANGRPFKEGILDILQRHADLHQSVLAKHLGQHIKLLSAG